MKYTVKPFGEYVLFKHIIKEKTDGGIILSNAEKAPSGFEVVDIGDEVKSANVGDLIIFKANTPISIQNEGVEKHLYLILESEIVGKLNKTEEV
jgi:co-chaperonin GroES (HSP10)